MHARGRSARTWRQQEYTGSERCANTTYTRALRKGGEGVSSPWAKVRVDFAGLNIVRAHSEVRLQLQGLGASKRVQEIKERDDKFK